MSSTSVEFIPPKQLGKYKIVELIDDGTYGYVYRARDEENCKIVAAKFGNVHVKNTSYKSLRKEKQFLRRTKHANIIRMLDFIKFLDTSVENTTVPNGMLVLEHCICDLQKAMMLVPNFSGSEIKTIMQQLCCSLAYLQENSIIHFDVKSANILLASDGNTKLCDFGLAKDNGSRSKRRGCTLDYAAPEVVLGVKRVDFKVDAWSAGCVFAELFKGDAIFDLQDLPETDQIKELFRICGSYSLEVWENLRPKIYGQYQKLKFDHQAGSLRLFLQEFVDDELALDLLSRLLVTDRDERWTCKQALESPYFRSTPSTLSDLKNLVNKVEIEMLIENLSAS